MKRCLYDAQHQMNPTSTEKMPGGFRSGDTLEAKESSDGWGYEYEQPRKGSVQEGVSMVEPMDSNQINYNTRNKRK